MNHRDHKQLFATSEFGTWAEREGLHFGGRFQWGALFDRGPWVYWYRPEEAAAELRDAGFRVVGIGTLAQIRAGQMCASAEELRHQPTRGALFCVCTK